MAVGAQARDIVRRVTVDAFSMVFAGALAGLALGMTSVRYIETLLYQVKATDITMLALPSLHHFRCRVAGGAAGGRPRGANRSSRDAACRIEAGSEYVGELLKRCPAARPSCADRSLTSSPRLGRSPCSRPTPRPERSPSHSPPWQPWQKSGNPLPDGRGSVQSVASTEPRVRAASPLLATPGFDSLFVPAEVSRRVSTRHARVRAPHRPTGL